MNTRTTHSHLTRLASGLCFAAVALRPAFGGGTALRPGYPTEFRPTALTADGSTVAGALPGSYNPPFSTGPAGQVWRAGTGFSPIGYWSFQPWRHAISADGNRIAGREYGFHRDWRSGACNWIVSEGSGVYMPNSESYGRGLALTRDGSKMLWADNDSDYGLFLWDGEASEKISTDTPWNAAISANGERAAYYLYATNQFRLWTRADGVETLPSLPDMISGGDEVVFSADRSHVYAMMQMPDGAALVSWDLTVPLAGRHAGLPETICFLPQGENAYPWLTIAGVSADERTIAFSVDSQSYIWNDESGLQTFESFLASRNIEFGPNSGITALCMNADASVFAGVSDSFWYLDLNNAPSFCGADFNFDRRVDDADFAIFAGAYDLLDCTDPDMPAACPNDINRDGLVDDADFVLFVTAYNTLLCD
ncbi:MAG: hypothetical protein KF691_13675 [Phycisphaeraceae bacterium]|nr:hypothetical protein [Phycisphaeraceae bacterium]